VKLTLATFGLFAALTSAGCAQSSSSAGTREGQVPNPIDKPEQTSDSRCSTTDIDGQSYSYCVVDLADQLSRTTPRPWDNTINIVYYWHGLNGAPEEIIDGSILNELSKLTGDHMPVVVSMSMGPKGVVTKQASAITLKLIPSIEKKIVQGDLPISRQMAGMSMGGFNTLRVVGETPAMFKAAQALCPALVAFNPHSDSEVQNYLQRNKAVLDIPFFQVVLNVFRSHFSHANDWAPNNPFTFLTEGKYNSVDLFLSAGSSDELGFFEGVDRFKKADARGSNPMLQTSIVSGRHCSFDSQRLVLIISMNLVTGL
jgi:hypothetical protein